MIGDAMQKTQGRNTHEVSVFYLKIAHLRAFRVSAKLDIAHLLRACFCTIRPNMIRKAFLMSVNPYAHAEYERRHNPIWAELAETLTQHGVSNYSIFLEPETNQLFGYAEIESEELWASIAETEVCRRWWAFMKDVMPTNADNSPLAVELKEVFHLA